MSTAQVTQPGRSAILEVGLMFLPAIPAYLWIWPVVSGFGEWVFQILAYIYVLAGTLIIGLRRWSLSELGINRKGIGLSLICGLFLLAGRLLIVLAIDLGLSRPQYSLTSLVGNILFYFGLVAVVEELLYRGVIYQALDEWLGVRWAIWGSSIGFLLWHLFGQGPLVGLAAFYVGLVFALLRWRAGGIVGLILLHGLYDLESVILVSSSSQQILNSIDRSRPEVLHPPWLVLGLGLFFLVPLYLWKVYPRFERQ